MAEWLDEGDHGIAIGLEYGPYIDADTGGPLTFYTVYAKISGLEAWIKSDGYSFSDNFNTLSWSGAAVSDGSVSNLAAGTSSSKKLYDLPAHPVALRRGATKDATVALELSGIGVAGKVLEGSKVFTFPPIPYSLPASPVVTIGNAVIYVSGNQLDPDLDRFWQTLSWYLEKDGVSTAVSLGAPGSGTSMATSAFVADSRYRGAVFATNSSGNGPTGYSLYYYTSMTAPGTPTVQRAFNSTTVNVAWAAGVTAGYARTYLVERSLDGGAYVQIASTTGLAYADTVPLGSVARYRVRAQAPSGGVNRPVSSYSTESAQSPTGRHWGTPAAPVVTLALTGTSSAAIGISGNQTNPTLDSYWEYVDWQISVDGAEFGSGAALPGTTTSVPLSGLSADSKIEVRVKSRNSEGGSSSYVQPPAIYTTPNAPSSLSAARVSISSEIVNLSWTNNADWPGLFFVERSLDGGSTWSQVLSTAATTASTTQTVSAVAQYRVCVAASAGAVYSAYSASVEVGGGFVSNRSKMPLGLSTIDHIYVGSQRIRRVSRGTSVLWEDGDA